MLVPAIRRWMFACACVTMTVCGAGGARAQERVPDLIPANDLCADAIAVGLGSTSWNNAGASTDGPTPAGGGCDAAPQQDIWFSYVPACGGTNRISLCGTPFDAVLVVYAGSCGSLGTPIACNDDDGPACTGVAPSVDVDLTAGHHYLLRVGSYYAVGEHGTGTLTISCASSGACCSGAICSVQVAATCTGAGTHFAGAGTTCNATGNYTSPCCKADFNESGTVTVQDIFDFLAAWFAGDPRANINGAGGITVQDIFKFLGAWFAGCT